MIPNYTKLIENLSIVKKKLDRPLTLAEKILYSHLDRPDAANPVRGESYLKLRPDRVAMQDASAQTAILQFMLANLPQSAVPTSIHCDHLVEADTSSKGKSEKLADENVKASWATNSEIYEFLESASKKYGIQFWNPGAGIIHQIVLENYATPGALMLGTDSHTPNAGGLNMIAIGVGGADAVDAMCHIPWELKAPKITGVHLKGRLSGWTSPKDIILYLAGLLTVRGGTGHIMEYFGEGVESLSATGMATVCNMGAEIGATTSLFPYTQATSAYLKATHRSRLANLLEDLFPKPNHTSSLLHADSAVLSQPDKYYDRVIEIDLTKLEPRLNGPFTPDRSIPVSQIGTVAKKEGWDDQIRVGLIGSCTNSSYEDMTKAVSLVKQARDAGLTPKSEFLVTPGSEQIRATIERDGLIGEFENAGAEVLANACGPCIGQWNRTDLPSSTKQTNTILSSFNRNFASRNDGNPNTMNFLASPEIVTAMAFGGSLSFNPITDTITTSSGKPFKFSPPTSHELPAAGFAKGESKYDPPSITPPQPDVQIQIAETSQRLQPIYNWNSWDGKEMDGLKVLAKVKGKCTTDHISAAGKWLKYKGHLENISKNTLIGALNADLGENEIGKTKNLVTGEIDTIPNVAKYYKAQNMPWMVIADHNYGEGSAREHAALQPRFLGGLLILSKSFARIHETNLKKQGILPLTFANPEDYDKIKSTMTVSTVGLKEMVENNGKGEVKLVFTDEETAEKLVVDCNHTMSEDQVEWFKYGSALNVIAEKSKNGELKF
ncbi:aconitate hydratase 2 [Paraphysoderma sedebokerense]|nr:aconitate hydratase 2 [Paraphysoderma sedebokerense]